MQIARPFINSENIKNGKSTGIIEFAQIIIAVFVPSSVTEGNIIIKIIKRHDAMTIILLFIVKYINFFLIIDEVFSISKYFVIKINYILLVICHFLND